MNALDRVHAMVERAEPLGRALAVMATRPHLPTLAVAPAPVPASSRRAKVSVIIPCYNYGHFLSDSVGSALEQSGVDVEVIVVDDASTDDSATVAAKLVANDSRVVLVQNPANAGHVVTFNNGYASASGEFIVRLDADDLLTPGSLERAVALFDTYPRVGLVYGRPQHFRTAHPPTPRLIAPSWTVWPGQEWLAYRCHVGSNCITTPEAVIRASVMKDVGHLDTRLRFSQDMEMWLRVSAVSDVGHVNGPDQALHRDHPTSMSVTTGAAALVDLAERRTVFEVVFDRIGHLVPGAAELNELAHRALAVEALGIAKHACEHGRADGQPVNDLEAFALETYPEVRELLIWSTLQTRRAEPIPSALRMFWYGCLAASDRIRAEYRYLQWARYGV